MSFSLTLNVQKQVNYPSLGLIQDPEDASVEATIEVTGITQLFGSDGLASYVVTVGGVAGSVLSFPFVYSGEGNPISEAEAQLQTYLSA